MFGSPRLPIYWSCADSGSRRAARRIAQSGAARAVSPEARAGAAQPLTGPRGSDPLARGDSTMRIHNLYEDAAGTSHFQDIEVAWEELRESNQFSVVQPASGIIFRETTQDYTVDWHPAPRRQYVINLDSAVHISAGDG